MKPMTARDRLEAFWSGARPDVIPFTIYWNEWRHTADDPAWKLLFAKGLGLTRHVDVVKYLQPDVEAITVDAVVDGQPTRHVSLRSPIGEVQETYVDGWRRKHFLETADDYRVMIDIVKRTETVPAYEAFRAEEERVGETGAALAYIGRTPLQTMLVDWAGLENLGCQFYEMGAAVEELYAALLARFRRTVELAAVGPGHFVSVLENFTAESLGPERYKRYLIPVYEEMFPVLRAAGKVVGVHYDGRLAACRDAIATAPIDLIESLTPPPEGDLSLAEARRAWPDKLFWSNINVALYDLPPRELAETVLARTAEASVDGRLLAFEVSEQYPANWRDSLAVVLDALEMTRGN